MRRSVLVLLPACLAAAEPPAADPELTNYKSGIDVVWQGTKGVDYAEEYLFHDKLVDDHKVVFIRSGTKIAMRHNARNNVFIIDPAKRTSRMLVIGADGTDGKPDSGDEGIIRYKLDRDRQYFFKWTDNPARSITERVLPAYTAPFALADLTYEPGVPVVGTTGDNGGDPATRSAWYQRGIRDEVGDEWHVLSYADDDNVMQRAAKYDHAYWASDGKTVLLVVDPKTPCLSVRASGSGQFYTTPPKAYWTPRIVPQTTYLAAGKDGEVTIELRDITGHAVHYRLNDGPEVDAKQASVTLRHDAFKPGANTLTYWYAGNEKFRRIRTVVRDPAFPSAAEKHGDYLWGDAAGLATVRARLQREPYAKPYRLSKEADRSGWEKNSFKGLRYTGGDNLHQSTGALKEACIALIEGPAFVPPGTSKTCVRLAREMLLDHQRTIDPLGFEMLHTDDAIPNRELHYRGYYDSTPSLYGIFAYDLMVAHFRIDQVPDGITAIEDLFVRDRLAGFAYEAMQWTAGNCALGDPGMWGGARIMTATSIAMIMREYSSPYYGTSGFGTVQTTFPLCPFPDDRMTWKQALFDGTAKRGKFPNFAWHLGLSDVDPDSILLAENQPYAKTTWPLATWRNKAAYMSYGLMGMHLGVWANMAKLWGGGRTDPRLEIAFQRAADGTFIGATDPAPQKGARHHLITLINARWPEIAAKNRPWVQSLPPKDNNSDDQAMMEAGVFGYAWYDDDKDGAAAKP